MSDFAACFIARQVASDEEIFARDARYAADLLNSIASNPVVDGVTAGDLARLSARVTELIRLSAKIGAMRETALTLTAEGAR
ncbi:hypothetical protein [Streptomyces sp. SID5910]|uniref:hypothetical protein n=1 Tax=Streptomyces sp. SID5910 TaxID=2690312 RepID=UPI0013709B68|nr:hypothetical protein [Streptomyces sp. SID5910]MYR43126.1 hypothetical protein [Streptomyces sp. SID5910]